jgi:hypothetical protein
MWLSQAECLFELQGVTCQVKRYCYMVASLTHESMRRVSELVEQQPDQDPYEVIKARLLSALQLTDYQQADKLFDPPGLGAMSQMLETCPRGEERSQLFACLFLRRLPREIWVLLTKGDHKDPKGARRAGGRALGPAHPRHRGGGSAGDVRSVDDAAINAPKQQSRDKVSGDRRKMSWSNKKKEKSNGQGPSLSARLESGLCHVLWVYGESATTCHKPCTWQGNWKAEGNYNYLLTYDSYVPVYNRFHRGEWITRVSGGEGALDTPGPLNGTSEASLDQQTHLHHLRLVLERLREGGLLLVQGRQPGFPGVTGCWLAACSHSLLMSRPSWRSLIHWTPLSCRDFWA